MGEAHHWHDVLLLKSTLHDLSDAEQTQVIIGSPGRFRCPHRIAKGVLNL